MQTVLNSTNTTNGGIGMSKSQWVLDAERRGWNEAILDVFCFLTGDEQILDYPERFVIIEAMVAQVNAHEASRLREVTNPAA